MYQLITIAVLNHSASPLANYSVTKNGASIYHGNTATHVVLDQNNQKFTLQISTPPEQLGQSWKRLLSTAEYVLTNLCSNWKAVRPELLFYCAHCLYLNEPNPDCKPSPAWFQLTYKNSDTATISKRVYEGMEPVLCKCDGAGHQPTVPSPLRFPCMYQEVTHE